MWTAFGIMLGYLSGLALHNVGGSGRPFTSSLEDSRLELTHSCGNQSNKNAPEHLLTLPCVRSDFSFLLDFC